MPLFFRPLFEDPKAHLGAGDTLCLGNGINHVAVLAIEINSDFDGIRHLCGLAIVCFALASNEMSKRPNLCLVLATKRNFICLEPIADCGCGAPKEISNLSLRAKVIKQVLWSHFFSSSIGIPDILSPSGKSCKSATPDAILRRMPA